MERVGVMLSVFTQPLATGRGGIKIRAGRPTRRTDTNKREHMPGGCGGCHAGAIAVAHTASAVRDLGVAAAVSIAAASALGIGHKRGLFDAPHARSAASDADADQAKCAALEIHTAVS